MILGLTCREEWFSAADCCGGRRWQESPSCCCNRVKQLDGDLMHSEARRSQPSPRRMNDLTEAAGPVYYAVFLLHCKPVMIAMLLDWQWPSPCPLDSQKWVMAKELCLLTHRRALAQVQFPSPDKQMISCHPAPCTPPFPRKYVIGPHRVKKGLFN